MEYEKDSVAATLRAVAQQTLGNLLNEISGPKDLVISSELISPLDMVCSMGSLKNVGVEKIYKLEAKASTPGSCERCCFLLRNNVQETKLVTELILADKAQNKNVKYHIIYIPRITRLCDAVLEREGVHGYVQIVSCPLYFIPLDIDLLSLEQQEFFTSLFLNRDQTNLIDIAKALVQLQSLVGPVASVYGQGRYACMIVKVMKDLLSTQITDRQTSYDSVFTDLVVFDRDVDYVSCLLSQLNYEGLLDEEFEIKCGKVSFPSEVTKTPQGIRQVVHSTEPVFRDIRDTHLSAAFSLLKEKGSILKQKHIEMKNMNLNDIKDFVQTELKSTQEQYKSLGLHVSACEVIMERKKEGRFVELLKAERNIIEGQETKDVISFIEDSIISQQPMSNTLRLLCLLSLLNDGLSTKDYHNLVKLFLQSYGHKHIMTFYNLKKLDILHEHQLSASMFTNTSSGSASKKASTAVAMGASKVLSVLPSRSQYRAAIKRLNLIPQVEENRSYDLKNPSDAGFVFGGSYIAIICRLIELLILDRSETNGDDLLKLVPGEKLYKRLAHNAELPVHRRVILVAFIGGVTLAEMTALRFLAKQRGCKVIVATSHVINGNQLIKCVAK
ncbi:Vacuolar protein sorting-associated protein 33B [Halotydeus destructor]|nr:Vacuolar protein sorting-associated protein 33B [Halotydeus destructor]